MRKLPEHVTEEPRGGWSKEMQMAWITIMCPTGPVRTTHMSRHILLHLQRLVNGIVAQMEMESGQSTVVPMRKVGEG